ncbi:MAG: TIGR03960 family B12-binding radical SAM protein [Phycisphaerae bacterium]|nr:TIGR03960 family B12-binding radical SAM protein [Phycisphaerae bacterium]
MNELHRKIRDEFLPVVTSPGQYIGGEFNQVRKDVSDDGVTVALGFPDTYAIGMSHLGLAILYTAVNQMEDVVAERVYCPWLDAGEVMRDKNITLFSWESRTPIREFDILGITLQHELAYTNVLYMLDLAGITFRADQRHEDEPLVIGGGPVADSCEPVADFFDLVVLGDGEDALPAVIEAYRVLKKNKATRREMLIQLARQFPFVYVPQFYQCDYNDDGTLAYFEPTIEGLSRCIQRAQVMDLDNATFPTAPLLANTESTHDRIAIEVMRGCPQRCAFCHAGHTRGKLRSRSINKIVELAWQSYLNTGHDTVSLLSLSTSDYPDLAELVKRLYHQFENCRVGISLPSLRVDKQLRDVPGQVSGTRREGLTLAVEAASGRMRRAIGKKVTDEDLIATMRTAYEAGWQKVKLYYMVGFPGETQEDIMGILHLTETISRLRREVASQPATVNAAVSWLVPKPHTPFGWIPQQSPDYFLEAKRELIHAKRQLKGVSINLKFHHTDGSMLEAVFARGDRRLSKVLETAYRMGAKFDSWHECFDFNRYMEAFKTNGIDPAFYASRQRGEQEILPWDHLDGGNKEHLYHRYMRIMKMLQE